MARLTLNTLAAEVRANQARTDAALESISATLAVLADRMPAQVTAPAAPVTQPKAEDEGFVTWLRETAEARAERKATNRELAAALRKVGINPAGPVWEAAKKAQAAGKPLNVRALKAMARAHAAKNA